MKDSETITLPITIGKIYKVLGYETNTASNNAVVYVNSLNNYYQIINDNGKIVLYGEALFENRLRKEKLERIL
jgi:hypothetical protein